jgi:hypothetical protein
MSGRKMKGAFAGSISGHIGGSFSTSEREDTRVTVVNLTEGV